MAKTTKKPEKATEKKENENFFQKNKILLIVSGVIILVVIIAAIVAVSIINNNKEQERLQREEEEKVASIEKFKNIYLMNTGDFSEEQGECIWGQINTLVNEDDILIAAKDYEKNGVINSKSTFANKVYTSVENIYKKCSVTIEDAEKSIDKITDVVDITLSGNGTTSSEVFTLKKGLAEFTITGVGAISVSLEPISNNYVYCGDSFGDPYVGTATYTKKCTIDYAGDYFLNINNYAGMGSSGGAWTVNIRQEG